MKQHITRAYNSFYVNPAGTTITKISESLEDEISFYKGISDYPESIFFPRCLGFRENEIDLEYYAYDNLGDYMVFGEFDSVFWDKVVEQLHSILDKFSNTPFVQQFSVDIYAKEMYVSKTERYYDELLKNPRFQKISEYASLTINDVSYLNFENIWGDVKKIIERDLIEPLSRFCIIHGDMCFSNILCGINDKTDICILRFIDPRGYFGVRGIFGDPLYDHAKLLHSYEGGYEYIIYDQFSIEKQVDPSSFVFEFSNDNKDKIKEVFADFGNTKSKLIEGLIYIGMCSRHYDSEDRQLVMYATGIKLLNEVLS